MWWFWPLMALHVLAFVAARWVVHTMDRRKADRYRAAWERRAAPKEYRDRLAEGARARAEARAAR